MIPKFYQSLYDFNYYGTFVGFTFLPSLKCGHGHQEYASEMNLVIYLWDFDTSGRLLLNIVTFPLENLFTLPRRVYNALLDFYRVH